MNKKTNIIHITRFKHTFKYTVKKNQQGTNNEHYYTKTETL